MEVLTLRKHSQQSSGFLTHHSSSRSVLSLHCTHLPDSDPTAEQDRGSLHLTRQAYRELCDAKLLAKLTKPRKEPREAMGLQTANSQQTLQMSFWPLAQGTFTIVASVLIARLRRQAGRGGCGGKASSDIQFAFQKGHLALQAN